eukprot:CAMPEP_0198290440 /NCGR_PEP_ID=MMETSP1449-20131203/8310_1 /TAXON_ID=420275 /ORGANISM="Attheya septentrionalis, Strain CCMP2084" /LENGTH=813 /DNA_ID=CAMNT_0043988945 /DNA_START=72 /DNA_END=2513 /DNA_ORIENTATION=+
MIVQSDLICTYRRCWMQLQQALLVTFLLSGWKHYTLLVSSANISEANDNGNGLSFRTPECCNARPLTQDATLGAKESPSLITTQAKNDTIIAFVAPLEVSYDVHASKVSVVSSMSNIYSMVGEYACRGIQRQLILLHPYTYEKYNESDLTANSKDEGTYDAQGEKHMKQKISATIHRHIVENTLACSVEEPLSLEIRLIPLYPSSQIPNDDSASQSSDLTIHLKEKLPSFSFPFHFSYVDIAIPINEAIRSAFASERKPDVLVMDVTTVGGVLFAEHYKIPIVLLAQPMLLDLMATSAEYDALLPLWMPSFGTGIAVSEMSRFQGIQSLVHNRLIHFLLTKGFMNLNGVRRQLGLQRIRNPAAYFERVAAIIVNTAIGFEFDRIIPNNVHLVGPSIGRCIVCDSNAREREEATTMSNSNPTVLITNLKLSRVEWRALIQGLSFARESLESFSQHICKAVETLIMASIDDDDEEDVIVFRGLRQECDHLKYLSRFHVVFLTAGNEDGGEASMLLPEVLPSFVSMRHSLSQEQYLASHHRNMNNGTIAVISECSLENVGVTLAFDVPIVCIPLKQLQADVAARIRDAECGVVIFGGIRTETIQHVMIEMLVGDKALRLNPMVVSKQIEMKLVHRGPMGSTDGTMKSTQDSFFFSSKITHNAGIVGKQLVAAGGIRRACDIVELVIFPMAQTLYPYPYAYNTSTNDDESEKRFLVSLSWIFLVIVLVRLLAYILASNCSQLVPTALRREILLSTHPSALIVAESQQVWESACQTMEDLGAKIASKMDQLLSKPPHDGQHPGADSVPSKQEEIEFIS